MSYYNPMQPFPQNPYGIPTSPNQNPFQQPQQNQPMFALVSSVDGAKNYPLQMGQSAILMDTSNSACYIKSVNGMGQASLEFYRLIKCSEADLRPAPPQPAQPAVTKEDLKAILDRLDKLEGKEAKQ